MRGEVQRISFEPIVRRRWLVIAVFGALVAAAAPGWLRLHTDNSPEGFFVEDHVELARFEHLERDFGRDRGVRIVLEGAGLWTRRGLAWLGALESAAAVTGGGPGGVYGTAGPVRYHLPQQAEWPPADPRAFRRLVLSDPIDRNAGWVDAKGELVTVIAGLFKLSPDRQERTLEALEAMLAPGLAGRRGARPAGPDRSQDPSPAERIAAGPPPGVHGFLAGLPTVGRALDHAQWILLWRLVPALLLVAAILLAAIFRSVSGVVLPFLLVGVCLAVTLGSMGYSGARLDFVAVLLVPMELVIALATAVHVLAYHRRLLAAGEAPSSAATRTYRIKAWPVLWTGMTTCVGFASLGLSPVPPVRALGLWTAFGIAFMTLAALSLFPALLAAFTRSASTPAAPTGKGPKGIEAWIGRRGRAWARSAVGRSRLVYAAFGAVALVAAAGLPRMRVDTNTLDYFPSDHPVVHRMHRLEGAGLGPVSASLVLDAGGESPGFARPEALRRLSSLAAEIRRLPLVAGAISAGDLVADQARLGPAAPPGADPLTTARARMAGEPGHAQLLRFVMTGDARRTRLLLFTPMRGYTELEPVYRRAVAAAHRAFPTARAWVTGEYPLIVTYQRALLRTIVVSLSATFLVIAALLAGLLRSPSLALRALVPNLWPVLLVLGAMGWLGVPVDSTTVMVAAVALGLAVDDTLHTLGHLRRQVGREGAAARGAARRELVGECLGEVAGGHVTSSVLLCLGFAVAASSELLPVARFGALTALAVAGALAADLLLVPALLAAVSERVLRRLAPPR